MKKWRPSEDRGGAGPRPERREHDDRFVLHLPADVRARIEADALSLGTSPQSLLRNFILQFFAPPADDGGNHGVCQ
jgi:hypothetical protein